MADNTRKTSNVIHEVDDLKDQVEEIQEKIDGIVVGDGYISTINNTKPDDTGNIGIIDAGNVEVGTSGNNITLAVDLSDLAEKGDIPTVNDGRINLQASNGVKLAADSQNATANQSGTTTFKVESDLEYLNANLEIPESNPPNDGQINMTGGTGIDVTGQNATANQANNTAWTVKTDDAYLNANLDFAKPDDIPTQYVKDIQSGNLLTLTVDEEDGVYTLTAVGGGGGGGTGDIAFGEGQCIDIEAETVGDLTTYTINCDLECLEANLNFVKPGDLPDVPTKTSELTNDGEDGLNPFITAADIPDPPDPPTVPEKTSDLVNDGEGTDPFITAADIPDIPAGNLPISSVDGTVVLADSSGSYTITTGSAERVVVDDDGHVAINPGDSSASLPRANTMLEVVSDTASPFPLILDGTKSTGYEGRTGIRMYNGASNIFEYFIEQNTSNYGFTGGSNARSGILYGETSADIYVVPGSYVEIQPELHVDQIKTFNDAVGDVDLALSGKCFKVNFEGSGTNANAMAGTSWSPLMVASQQYVTGSEDPADDETGWVENWGFTIESRNKNWNDGAGSFGVGFISVVPGNDVISSPHMIYRTSGSQGGGHIFMTAAYDSNPNAEEYSLWIDVAKNIIANKNYIPRKDNHLVPRKFVTGGDANATGGYLPLAGGTMDIGGDVIMPSGNTDPAQLQVGGDAADGFGTGINICARGRGSSSNKNVQIAGWATDGGSATLKLCTGNGKAIDHFWNFRHQMEGDDADVDAFRITSTGSTDWAAFIDHPDDGESIRFSFDTTFLQNVKTNRITGLADDDPLIAIGTDIRVYFDPNTDNNEVLSILHTQRVGVNTAAPLGQFHVSGEECSVVIQKDGKSAWYQQALNDDLVIGTLDSYDATLPTVNEWLKITGGGDLVASYETPATDNSLATKKYVDDHAGSGGGASSLAELTDVDITDPLNNQVLTYDEDSLTWVNKNPRQGGAIDGGQVPGSGSTYVWHDTYYPILQTVDGIQQPGRLNRPYEMFACDGVFSDGTWWTTDGTTWNVDPNSVITTSQSGDYYLGKFQADTAGYRGFQGRVVAGNGWYWVGLNFSQDMKQWDEKTTGTSNFQPMNLQQYPVWLSNQNYFGKYEGGSWQNYNINDLSSIMPEAGSPTYWFSATQKAGLENAWVCDGNIYCVDFDAASLSDDATANQALLASGITKIATDTVTAGCFSERLQKWFFAAGDKVLVSNTDSLKGGFTEKVFPSNVPFDRCFDDGQSIVFALTGAGNSVTNFSVDGEDWQVSVVFQNRDYGNICGTNGRGIASDNWDTGIDGFIPDPSDPDGEGVLPTVHNYWRYAVSGIPDPNDQGQTTATLPLGTPVDTRSSTRARLETQADANGYFDEEIKKRALVVTLTQAEYDAIPVDEIDDNTLYLITS